MKIKWGILGCGNIANSLAIAIRAVDNCDLVAVASTDSNRAKDFALKYEVNDWYTGYESLLKNNSIDAVYIANLHHQHLDAIEMCLKYNKHVLCEKPLSFNSCGVDKLYKRFEEKGLLLMEAMWTKFFPTIKQVKVWFEEGICGDPVFMQADFGFANSGGDKGRHLNAALCGGALLDVGIYPLSLALMVFGRYPDDIEIVSSLTSDNIDKTTSFALKFGNNHALLSCSVVSDTPQNAIIQCQKGRIDLPRFWNGTKVIFTSNSGEIIEREWNYSPNGYVFEIEEFCSAIQSGDYSKLSHQPQDTVKQLHILDQLRKKAGIKYPFE